MNASRTIRNAIRTIRDAIRVAREMPADDWVLVGERALLIVLAVADLCLIPWATR